VLFYSKPEPLSREMHGKLGLKRMDRPFSFAATSNVVPLTVAEFPVAGICYPINFAGERYQPLAVMGVSGGTNLYVKPDGAFEVGAYIPAYIRRYPFVLASDQTRSQLVVCIDRDAAMLGEDYDLPFFNEKGEPTDYTNGCIQFCNDFETEGRRTESFINLLKDLDLFEVKRATFTPTNPDGSPGQPQPVAEYFAVSDEKLKKLSTEQIKDLFDNGALSQILAHQMSLAGWDRLIALTLANQVALPTAANVN
jgi:hypothetical protein